MQYKTVCIYISETHNFAMLTTATKLFCTEMYFQKSFYIRNAYNEITFTCSLTSKK